MLSVAGCNRRIRVPGLSIILLASMTLASVPSARAAKNPAAKTATFADAAAYYKAGDWAKAAAAFESVVESEPQNGRAWHRLGVSFLQLKQYEKAIAAERKSIAIGNNAASMYKLACAFALSGAADSALAWLGHAADAGYRQPDVMESDADLASLRSDGRFAAVVERVRRIATPCAYAPEARQFDFWVGSWDVYTPQGDLAGTNDIRLGAGDCVLIENWKSTQGGLGQSLNFYDSDAKLWRQIWIDADAVVTRFEGAFTEGAMRFRGERVEQTGARTPVKMTFTPQPDGRVRQMGEVSNDGGASWSVEYDLYYARAKREG